MRFTLAAVSALVPALVAAQQNILVQVGANNALVFNPTNITANNGDTVTFQFQNKNHSVTQSTFGNPCAIQTTPAQGIDSGFQLVAANATELPEWSVTITNASAPLWFFCAQTIPADHCQAGMVFSINANPNSNKSYADYLALAKSGNAAAAPPPAGGASSAGAGAPPASATDAGAAAGAISTGISDITSAAGAGAAAATSVGAPIVNGLTSAAAGAAGAATSALGGAAAAATSALGGAGFRVSAVHPITLLAGVGLFAGLLL